MGQPAGRKWQGTVRGTIGTRAAAAGALALAVFLTGCSSSGKHADSVATQGGKSAASESPITLGVLADLTGVAASTFNTAEKGVKAAVGAVNAAGGVDGHKLNYVMADTASSAAGAASAARSLVSVKHVFAVVHDSAFTFAAEPFLLKAGVPVLGGSFDGPEWDDAANTNMFAVAGTTASTKVSATSGLYMKAQGVTSCGAVGFSGSQSSTRAATAINDSCQAAGLKAGYLNTQIPFGSTDMAPVAIAIKNSGIDGIQMSMTSSSEFALVEALRTNGVKLKSILLQTGYGGDLLEDTAAVAAAQGVDFVSATAPVEAGTAVTNTLKQNLSAYAGVTTSPTFAEIYGYLGVMAFQKGVEVSAAPLTHTSFIAGLRGVHDWDGNGLFTPSSIDFSNYESSGQAGGVGTKGCVFVLKLSGKAFAPVSGSPFCGGIVDGITLK